VTAETARPALDPITVEVVAKGIAAAAREMGITLRQTSSSPIFNEGNDYSCAIFDARGRLVSHGEFLPIHLGSLPFSVNHAIEELGRDRLEPGDSVVLNDPFRGGSHLPDVTLVTPIFLDGELIGFGANRAHHLDIGGTVAGSFYAQARENYQEGLRLPPTKLVKRGVLDEELMAVIQANVRLPRQTRADLLSQWSANLSAAARMAELVGRYGRATVEACMEVVMDDSERRMRAIIATWPDGRYAAEDSMDNDGITDVPRTVRVTVEVRGDQLTVDFTGTDPQVEGPLNSVLGYSSSGVYMTVQAATDPDILPNDGCYRPVTIIAPEGTIVNPHFPAACTGGNEITSVIHNATFRALAQVPRRPGRCPRVMAGDQGSSNNLFLSGYDDHGERFVLYEYPEGGWGGTDGRDGLNAIYSIIGNTWNLPVEAIEMRYPIRIDRYELRCDSGGPGRWRGGLSVRRTYRLLAEQGELSLLGNRVRVPPFGLYGGDHGAPARYTLDPGTSRQRPAAPEFGAKKHQIPLRRGQSIEQETAGGGGFGDPLDRDPKAVAHDVAFGYVSAAAAAARYGVVVDRGRVDEAATTQRRAELRARRSP
jgi:N-methylhydantoinase B